MLPNGEAVDVTVYTLVDGLLAGAKLCMFPSLPGVGFISSLHEEVVGGSHAITHDVDFWPLEDPRFPGLLHLVAQVMHDGRRVEVEYVERRNMPVGTLHFKAGTVASPESSTVCVPIWPDPIARRVLDTEGLP